MGIFIALGGSGIKSLALSKAKIYAEFSDKSLFEQENNFLVIDTHTTIYNFLSLIVFINIRTRTQLVP